MPINQAPSSHLPPKEWGRPFSKVLKYHACRRNNFKLKSQFHLVKVSALPPPPSRHRGGGFGNDTKTNSSQNQNAETPFCDPTCPDDLESPKVDQGSLLLSAPQRRAPPPTPTPATPLSHQPRTQEMLREKRGRSPVRSQQQATATPGLAGHRGAMAGAAAEPGDVLDRRSGPVRTGSRRPWATPPTAAGLSRRPGRPGAAE